MGWVFNVLAIGLLLYLLYVALSKYGRIPLGREGIDRECGRAAAAASRIWRAM